MKHWVFDLDGTLVDSMKSYEDSIVVILKEFNIEVTSADLDRAYQFFNPHDYFATFFANPEHLQKAVNRLIELNKIYAVKTPAFEGIIKLLKALHDKGIILSVWTGRDSETAKTILQHSGISEFVKICVGRSCVKNNKPYPDGLLKILQEAKHHGDDVIMVGDHEYDMQGAKAAGVRGISVDFSGKKRHKVSAFSEKHFTTVTDLHHWALSHY